MEKKKKSIVIGVTSLLLVTLILLGLTYAYYRTRIVGNTNATSVSAVSKKLEVKYQNESATINATGIEPGYSATKTFEVKNTGSETVNYSVMLDNVENTFTRKEDWTYTISENGSTLKTGTLPNSNSYILYNETISAGVTKSYTLKIDYANLSNVDQSEDMGKKLSLRINIADSLGSTLSGATEGTLLYAIGRDNVISEPLSVPGKQPNGIKSYSQEGLKSNILTKSIDSNYQNKYFVYLDEYEFNETIGAFLIKKNKVINSVYTNGYSELEGKYILSLELDEILESEPEEKPLLNYYLNMYLPIIYKVVDATSTSFTYQKVNVIPKYVTESVLSSTEDDYGTSYYYRGNVDNNYVNYSGMCWQIVRVQGDGTIKLVLNDKDNECNASTYSITKENAVILPGYIRYGEDYNYINSEVKSVLDAWAGISANRGYRYIDLNSYGYVNGTFTNESLDTSKLVDAEWCADDPEEVRKKIGISYDDAPTLKCNTQESSSDVTKYTSKLGILSAEELAFAGMISSDASLYNYYGPIIHTNNYLTINGQLGYWTLSGKTTNGTTFVVDKYRLVESNVANDLIASVRPAIVLNSNVAITEGGNGTQSSPYVIN